MRNLNDKKILIIRLSALGDTIHTLPLAYALKKQFPNVKIDWIVEDKASMFIVNNPLLNKVYEIPKSKWKKQNKLKAFSEFFNLIKKIRQEKYDIVLDTQQLLKSGLILGLSAGKRKITLDCGREFSFLFANEIIKTGRKLFDLNYHVVKRNLEFAKYLGCEDLNPKFILPDFTNKYSQKIIDIVANIDKSKKTIVIAPCTTWKNKHWEIDGWIEVIKRLKNNFNIIITASEKEKNYTSKILSKINDPTILDLSGKTNLADLSYLYKNANIVISPDSGSAHIAWCSGNCKILTLFFATSADRTAPFGNGYYSLTSSMPCYPCMKKNCKKDFSCCAKSIKAEDIINFIEKDLQ